VRYFATASTEQVRQAMREKRIGCILSPGQGYKPSTFDDIVWIADNGCYANPDRTLDDYLAWLNRFDSRQRANCMFATALDVVGDCKATLRRFAECAGSIREAGYKVGFVGQDGAEPNDLPWEAFDAFFIGGTTEWKLGGEARRLAQEATRRNKWVHMGRVNSFRRMRYAAEFCDSADGTTMAFGPDLVLPRVLRWTSWLDANPTLPFEV
jgi:hypothetical protein